MALTKQEMKQLKGTAHHLKAVLNAGKEGLTEQFIKSTDEALSGRELIKIKFLDASDLDPKRDGAVLAEKLNAEVVTTIGFVVVLYRYSKTAKKHAIVEDVEEE